VFGAFSDALNAAAARTNVKVISLDAGANPATQVSDIQTFITKKVDAILVFPLVPEAENTILNKARQAGIKIIGLNAIMPSAYKQTPDVAAPYDANLDWGYVDGPYAEGKFVAQQLGGKGNVLGIKIPVPVPSLDAMLSAYQNSVTDGNPGIKWLTTLPDKTDDLAGARASMADAITRYHGDIQAVLAYTDISAIGAAQALEAAGVKNVVIVGQQGNPTGVAALKSGQIQADIDTQPNTAALWALKMVADVVNGNSYPKFARLPIRLLTKDNVDTWVPWSQGLDDIKSGKTSLDVTLSDQVTVGTN
jgi:ABC-type sugar transport system substrate-binding protein